MGAPEFPMPKTPGGLDMSDASTIRTLLPRKAVDWAPAQVDFKAGDEINGEAFPIKDSSEGDLLEVDHLRICLWELFEVAPRLSLRQWQKVKAAFDRVLM